MTKNELINLIDECDAELEIAPPSPVIITVIRSRKAAAIKELIGIVRKEIDD